MRLTGVPALLMLLCCSLAGAQTDDDAEVRMAQSAKVERDRIASERKAIVQKYNAEQKTCYQRFSVTDCIDKSKAWRRESLADLKRQDILLNDAERRRNAGEQLRKLEEKRAVDAEKKQLREEAAKEKQPRERVERVERVPPAERKTQAARASHAHVPDPKEIAAAQENARRKAQRSVQEAADRAARATQSAQETRRYEERQRAAAENKALKLKRNAESSGNAKPLPAP